MFPGVEVTLGDVNTRHFYGLNGESVLIQCVLSSGNFDTQQQRSWLANGVTLINSGVISSAGSGYSETFGSDRFGIRTPKLDKSFNGTNYKCFYGFDEANLLMNIAGKFKLKCFIKPCESLGCLLLNICMTRPVGHIADVRNNSRD